MYTVFGKDITINMGNTYATIDEANDYLGKTQHSEIWGKISDIRKEILLTESTKQIDRLKFKYFSLTIGQLLKCPLRTSDENLGDGFVQAKEASIIQACYMGKFDEKIRDSSGKVLWGTPNQTLNKVWNSKDIYAMMSTISPQAIRIMAPFLDMKLKAVK